MSSHFSDHQKESGSFGCNGKSVIATNSIVPCEQIAEQNNETFNPFPSPTNVHGFIGMVAGDNSKQLPTGAAPSRALTDFSFQGGKQHGTTATADLPFPNGLHSIGHSNQRDDVYNDNSHPFHRGIRCDGCGMYPIIGP